MLLVLYTEKLWRKIQGQLYFGCEKWIDQHNTSVGQRKSLQVRCLMDLHFQTLLTTAVSDFRDNNPREQFYFLSFTCPQAPRWRIGPRTSFPFRINSTILCPDCPTFFRLKAAPAERSEKGYGDENVMSWHCHMFFTVVSQTRALYCLGSTTGEEDGIFDCRVNFPK